MDLHRNHSALGRLEGPILLFGGPYSNRHATQAVLDLGFPAARMICTGDVCAYCADPLETARLVMAAGCPVVAGNCEDSLGNRREDCGCGFEEGVACDLLAGQWFAHADRLLDDAARDWMLRCPDVISFEAYGKRYAVIHGGASAVNRFVWPTEADAVLASEIALIEAALGPVDGVISGHTGMAFERRLQMPTGEKHWINAGAIGLPAHDGDPRTSYAVLDESGVRFERLSYDHEAAAAAMRDAGLRAGYDRSLLSGWWPSEESFPVEMRQGITSLDGA